MTQFRTLGLTALAAALLSGCVVQPVDRVPVQQPAPQPIYSAPQPGPLRIAGTWGLFESGSVVREVSVRRTRGGILVDTPRRRNQFASRVGRGTFRDDRGRIYQFLSSDEGVFTNPNNGRELPMRRRL